MLRAGFCGPAGSGKSVTAIKLGARMVEEMGLGPLFVIDTEHRSAKRYAFSRRTGAGYNFRHVVLESDFSPAAYQAALEHCEERGAGVVVIDSLSHAWNGMNGVLELVDQKADASQGKNACSAGWKQMSPIHTRFVERVMQSSAHVLFTVRAKMEWTVDRNTEGKLEPRRVGLAPVQRDGLEYEPDLFFDMTPDHTLWITKSRVLDWPGIETGAKFHRPDLEFADLVIGWLQDGDPPVDALAAHIDEAVAASVDRPSYEAARKRLIHWMTTRALPKFKSDAALDTLLCRVRAAVTGAAA
jgi:hypothetical protein